MDSCKCACQYCMRMFPCDCQGCTGSVLNWNRAITEHSLKIWPEPFAAVVDGRKRFEIRRDDRGYLVGDVLHLREWDPATETYSGRVQTRTVCYIARGWGLPDDMVVMGLDDGPAEFDDDD